MYGKLCGDELVMAAGHLENVYELDFHPGVKLAIVLYRNVKNSKDIRQRIQQGTLQPDFAFSDATTVMLYSTLLCHAGPVLVAP